MKTRVLTVAALVAAIAALASCHQPNNETETTKPAADPETQNLRQALFEGDKRFWFPGNDTGFFEKFFVQAETAQAKKTTLRVLHYGDSQVESDRLTAQLRDRMQELFGGGGPGLLPLKQPVPSLTTRQSTSGTLVGQSTYGSKPHVRCDGNYGPMLRSWLLNGSASTNIAAERGRLVRDRARSFSRVALLYNTKDTDGKTSLEVSSGDQRKAKTGSKKGVNRLEVKLDSAVTQLKVDVSGHADIYGLTVDDGYGVAVDNIGMRGVSGTQYTMVDSAKLADVYSLMNVGMILLQFGGNAMPGMTKDWQLEAYCKNIGRQIDFLHSVRPEAVVMLVGPADMCVRREGQLLTNPMLPKLDKCLRQTALAHDAAYWSVFQAMGGEGSMKQWVAKGLASKDYIHFSHNGAAQMGENLADAMADLYRYYRSGKK